MSEQDDTPRSPKHYPDDKKQIERQGTDESADEPRRDTRDGAGAQQRNRADMGVDAQHRTRKIRKSHRGTFP